MIIKEDSHYDLGQIILSLTHEIRNPLSAIELFASLQHEELVRKHQDPSLVVDIMVGVNKINNVITNLLYYACLPEPKLEKNKLEEIIEEISVFTNYSLRLNNINIKVNACKDNIWIIADKEQIKQCFMNLILNSFQNLPNGGEIIINLKINKNDEDDLVCIEITDSRKITNEDMKLDLGLPITKKIVSMHNGKLEVICSPKFTFKLYIPFILL